MGGKHELALLQVFFVFSVIPVDAEGAVVFTEKARVKRSDSVLFAFDACTAFSQHPWDELRWAASIDGLSFTLQLHI